MAEDRRSARTRRAIKQAARNLIVERPGERLTVRELAERSDINRKTFYLHYPCIEDLLQDLLADVLVGYLEEMAELQEPLRIADTNRVFFSFFARQDEWVQVMVRHEAYAPYVDRMLHDSLGSNRKRSDTMAGREATERGLIDYFMVSASLMLYRYWKSEGSDLALAQVIDLTSTLLEHGVSSLRDQMPA